METVTILLADDEAMLLLDFENSLTDAGFLVRAVTSSGKAVEILNSPNSAIGGVVTDMRFGELPHGWEDARIAREIEPDMPIVYISCGLAIKRGAEQHYYDRKAVYLGATGDGRLPTAQRQTAPSSE